MIVLDAVARTYGEGAQVVEALKPLSLQIAAGTVVAIIGPSGSGKSTLLHLLGALDRPTSGRILVDGVDLGTLDDDHRTELRREKIGFVFQFFHLLETLTARENVMLPARLAGRRGADLERRADELLAEVGLADRRAHLPAQLSGGELQRIAVARALMMDPPLILADEPTGNLDSENGEAVLTLLTRAVSGRRTIVLVTHDPRIAARADRVVSLKDGGLVADETRRS
ncbi:MAG: ABC transporter ATP-binding protein [Deltaproteobacteria bacterium]|nr:ABC transporter ATP-binding protein [Deltaproteobacteria bacterium]